MKKAFYVLADFDENIKTDTRGKNYRAKCPGCGKWNLYILKDTGLYNCFTGGCEFKGILQDFCEAKPLIDASSTEKFYPKRVKVRFVADNPKADGNVKMLPSDYKRLAPPDTRTPEQKDALLKLLQRLKKNIPMPGCGAQGFAVCSERLSVLRCRSGICYDCLWLMI